MTQSISHPRKSPPLHAGHPENDLPTFTSHPEMAGTDTGPGADNGSGAPAPTAPASTAPAVAMNGGKAAPHAGSTTPPKWHKSDTRWTLSLFGTAIGAGVPRRVVIARNVFRNALITPVTVLGMKIGYLMGGAIVIEIIFALPGMGTALFDGINNNQPQLVQGVVLVVALSFTIINIIVDMLYVLINPRIRTV